MTTKAAMRLGYSPLKCALVKIGLFCNHIRPPIDKVVQQPQRLQNLLINSRQESRTPSAFRKQCVYKLRVAELNTDDCIVAAVSHIEEARPESSRHPNLIGVASYAPTFRTPISRAAGHGLIAKSSK